MESITTNIVYCCASRSYKDYFFFATDKIYPGYNTFDDLSLTYAPFTSNVKKYLISFRRVIRRVRLV